jgi:hypothetical protein
MSSWSPADAIAMERRHIIEGQKRVARQEALVLQQIEKGHVQITARSQELLDLFRQSLELSRERLRDLELRYGNRIDS